MTCTKCTLNFVWKITVCNCKEGVGIKDLQASGVLSQCVVNFSLLVCLHWGCWVFFVGFFFFWGGYTYSPLT